MSDLRVGIQRLALVLSRDMVEDDTGLYLVRLFAFLLILGGDRGHEPLVASTAAGLTVGLTAGAAALLVHPRAGRLPKPDDTAEGAGVRLDHGALPSALVHHQVRRWIRGADVSLALGHRGRTATSATASTSEEGYCMR